MIKLPSEALEEIRVALDYRSVRAVKNNLIRLIELNWIGKDENSGYYFIRGFEWLLQEIGETNNKKALFYTQDIRELRSFVTASIMGDIIRKQRWIIKHELAQQYKGRAFQAHAKSISYYQPIANRYLAKVLSVAPSTAAGYKQEALHAGFIELKPDINPLDISSSQVPYYLDENPHHSTKIRRKNKGRYVYLRESDLVCSNIVFVRGKKPINNIKGLLGEEN